MVRLLLPLLLLPSALAAQDTIPAFPEARGWGATALAPCRALPLVVHTVTNADQGGAGSLRAALEAQTDSTYDIVVFRTGGRIHLAAGENLIINAADCLYVAGQTAPGGGITITGNQFYMVGSGAAAVDNSAGSDVVVRYLTLGKHREAKFDVVRIVLDHLTCYWSGSNGDGNCITLGTRPDAPGEFDSMPWEWTFSNSLLFEFHENHPTACHLVGQRGSVHGNVIAGPGHRLCLMNSNRMASSGIEFVNNIGYNWAAFGMAGVRDIRLDVYGNYFKRGPATNIATAWRRNPFFDRDECDDELTCDVSLYAEDNRTVENGFGLTLSVDSTFRGSQQQFVCNPTPEGQGACIADGDTVRLDHTRQTPFPGTAVWPVTRRLMTDELVSQAHNQAGNYQGLVCDGSWVARRDSLDNNAIANVINGTGRLQSEINFVGTGIPGGSPDPDEPGWVVPIPDAGTPCPDVDLDGMPDEWETIQCGSADCIDNDTLLVSGYVPVEAYIDGFNIGNPAPWAPPTFFNGRFVYLLPVDTVPFGTDNILVPDTTVIPRSASKVSIYNPAQDSVLTVICESYGESADSVTVDVRSRAWNRQGMRSAAEIRNRSLTALSC